MLGQRGNLTMIRVLGVFEVENETPLVNVVLRCGPACSVCLKDSVRPTLVTQAEGRVVAATSEESHVLAAYYENGVCWETQ